jgi:putative transposase
MYFSNKTTQMGNTYTQLYVQFVFAVQRRACLIQPTWRDELFKYITGIVQNNRHKMLAINGVADHVHTLVGLKPHQSISDLLQDMKGSSSLWINKNGFVEGKFECQEGYGAFSYSPSAMDNIVKYIHNQEDHHKKVSFKTEYLAFLREFQIEYDEKYILKDVMEEVG